MENLNIVIVGHVDHGKSTLIGRLLYDTNSLPEGKIEEIKQISEHLGKDLEFGFILDHMEEERKQGATIDTTQIFFRMNKRQYTIIDAPGHVEFIKNMITGASQAEAAILIVDVKEGIEEQTRRHSYIISMLGIEQVIVVLNKMDLIGYDEKRFEKVKKDVDKFLKSINVESSYMIPISAKEGDNVVKKSKRMDWYKGKTVLEALNFFEKTIKNIDKPLRFSVQDVYNFDNRIIVGLVQSGFLKNGKKITVLPSGEKTKVKTLEEYLKSTNRAGPGKAIGLTIDDDLFVDRGDVLVSEELPEVTDKIRGHIFWMDKTPFEKGEKLTFKCGTQEVICSIEKIKKVINSSTLEIISENTDKIENRQVADVLIKTEKPVVIDDFNEIQETGRFVLERMDTCAGGIITRL